MRERMAVTERLDFRTWFLRKRRGWGVRLTYHLHDGINVPEDRVAEIYQGLPEGATVKAAWVTRDDELAVCYKTRAMTEKAYFTPVERSESEVIARAVHEWYENDPAFDLWEQNKDEMTSLGVSVLIALNEEGWQFVRDPHV